MKYFSNPIKGFNKKDLVTGFTSCFGQGLGGSLFEGTFEKIAFAAIFGVFGTLIGLWISNISFAKYRSKINILSTSYYFAFGFLLLLFALIGIKGINYLSSRIDFLAPSAIIYILCIVQFVFGSSKLVFAPLIGYKDHLRHGNNIFFKDNIGIYIFNIIVFCTVLFIGPDNLVNYIDKAFWDLSNRGTPDYLLEKVGTKPLIFDSNISTFVTIFFTIIVVGLFGFSDD